MLRLNGLQELSSVMAKYPSEPGVQKYSASASKEIALSSIQHDSPTRRMKEMATEILQEPSSLEDLHRERFQQASGARYAGDFRNSRASTNGQNRTSASGNRKAAPVANYPSPARGATSMSYKDPLSFSKFASPIGKAPYLPTNMNSFAPPYPSSMSAAQQRSSLAILDGANGSEQMFASSQLPERKQFVKEERQSLLFETYGVQGIAKENHGTKTQGIKRKQLKTHLVCAADSTWATPVVSPKQLMRDEFLAGPSHKQPFSNRADVATLGSLAQHPQRTSCGGMDESMGEPMDVTDQAMHRSHRSELSSSAARKPTKKMKTRTTSTSRETFQIKVESDTQLRISKEMRSPFASPMSPSQKRSKSHATTSKNAPKAGTRSVHSNLQRSALKNPAISAITSESLTAYAAKLFNEDFGFGDSGSGLEMGTANALSAREKAEIQERERLSFAEKLHKMIDKTKSSLAVSNATSEPSSRSSRSSSSKLATAHPKATSRPVVLETSAPAVKKTRAPLGGAPKRVGMETAESAVDASSHHLSALSQPKAQAHEAKIQIGSKAGLSTSKKAGASASTAASKSTAQQHLSTPPTNRASKVDAGRPTQVSKSASKSKRVPASSKCATLPLATVQHPSEDVDMTDPTMHHGLDLAVTSGAVEANGVSERSKQDSPLPASDIAPEGTDASDPGETKVVSSREHVRDNAEPSPASSSEPGLVESEQVDSEVAADGDVRMQRDQPIESEESEASQEPARLEDEVHANTSEPDRATSSVDAAIPDVDHHAIDDEAKREDDVRESPTTAGTLDEVGDSIPVDAATIGESATESMTSLLQPESEEQPAASAGKVEAPESPESVQNGIASARNDALPVEDMYADEYNEFDEDAAGDEATEPADLLEEQNLTEAVLTGKIPLDELLSLADQVPATTSEQVLSGEAGGEDGTSAASIVVQERETPDSTLSSSKSGDDLDVDDGNPESERNRDKASSSRSMHDSNPEEAVVSPANGVFGAETEASETNAIPVETQVSEPTNDDISDTGGETPAPISSGDEASALQNADAGDVSTEVDAQSSSDVSIAKLGDDGTLNSDTAVADVDTEDSGATVAVASPEDDVPQDNALLDTGSGRDEGIPNEEATATPATSEACLVDQVESSQSVDGDGPPPGDANDVDIAAERPVSREADSYAEDGFDCEPDGDATVVSTAEEETPALENTPGVEPSGTDSVPAPGSEEQSPTVAGATESQDASESAAQRSTDTEDASEHVEAQSSHDGVEEKRSFDEDPVDVHDPKTEGIGEPQRILSEEADESTPLASDTTVPEEAVEPPSESDPTSSVHEAEPEEAPNSGGTDSTDQIDDPAYEDDYSEEDADQVAAESGSEVAPGVSVEDAAPSEENVGEEMESADQVDPTQGSAVADAAREQPEDIDQVLAKVGTDHDHSSACDDDSPANRGDAANEGDDEGNVESEGVQDVGVAAGEEAAECGKDSVDSDIQDEGAVERESILVPAAEATDEATSHTMQTTRSVEESYDGYGDFEGDESSPDKELDTEPDAMSMIQLPVTPRATVEADSVPATSDADVSGEDEKAALFAEDRTEDLMQVREDEKPATISEPEVPLAADPDEVVLSNDPPGDASIPSASEMDGEESRNEASAPMVMEDTGDTYHEEGEASDATIGANSDEPDGDKPETETEASGMDSLAQEPEQGADTTETPSDAPASEAIPERKEESEQHIQVGDHAVAAASDSTEDLEASSGNVAPQSPLESNVYDDFEDPVESDNALLVVDSTSSSNPSIPPTKHDDFEPEISTSDSAAESEPPISVEPEVVEPESTLETPELIVGDASDSFEDGIVETEVASPSEPSESVVTNAYDDFGEEADTAEAHTSSEVSDPGETTASDDIEGGSQAVSESPEVAATDDLKSDDADANTTEEECPEEPSGSADTKAAQDQSADEPGESIDSVEVEPDHTDPGVFSEAPVSSEPETALPEAEKAVDIDADVADGNVDVAAASGSVALQEPAIAASQDTVNAEELNNDGVLDDDEAEGTEHDRDSNVALQISPAEADSSPRPSKETVVESEAVPLVDAVVAQAQPAEMDAYDEFDAEPEHVEKRPAGESTAMPPPEVDAGGSESPQVDQYDDFEAEVAQIASDAPASLDTDQYDDFEADPMTTPELGSESPGFDAYEDFEASPSPLSPAENEPNVAASASSEATTSPIPAPDEAVLVDGECNDGLGYNDFEDEQEPSKPSPTDTPAIASQESTPREIDDDEEPLSPAPPIPVAPVADSARSEDVVADEAEYNDDDYAAEDDFEDDEKPTTTSAVHHASAAATPAGEPTEAPPVTPAQDDAENEYEAEYDAEYDDFDE